MPNALRVAKPTMSDFTSDVKIHSNRFSRPNRFTLPNRNEKFRFSITAYNTLATCITVLQDRVMAHIRVTVATRSSS